MREIRSDGYEQMKRAQGLPVGDPGLPGNLTERDISNAAEPPQPEYSMPFIQGESGTAYVVGVDFNSVKAEYEAEWGEQVPPEYSNLGGRVDLDFQFTFSYDPSAQYDFQKIQILDQQGVGVIQAQSGGGLGQIQDETFKDYLFEYFNEEIRTQVQEYVQGIGPESTDDGPDTREEMF